MLGRWLRAFRLGLLFLRFFIRGFFYKLRFFNQPQNLNQKLRESVTRSAAEFCQIFGIKVHARGFDQLRGKNRILTCNHLSYVDIIVLLSQEPFAFLTSKEVYQHWFTGPFIRFSGSSYVDRKSPSQLRGEYSRLEKLLEETPIVLFPEATSSNGRQVLSFKRALLEWARTQGLAVQTSCLRYTSWNQMKLRPDENHLSDRIHYYGEMGFFSHLWSFLETKNLEVILMARPEAFLPEQFETREAWLEELWTWTNTTYQDLQNKELESTKVEIKNVY